MEAKNVYQKQTGSEYTPDPQYFQNMDDLDRLNDWPYVKLKFNRQHTLEFCIGMPSLRNPFLQDMKDALTGKKWLVELATKYSQYAKFIHAAFKIAEALNARPPFDFRVEGDDVLLVAKIPSRNSRKYELPSYDTK